MYAALLAISVTALTILAGLSGTVDYDTPLKVAILCSAASTPFLAFCTERVRIDSQYKYRTHSVGVDLAEGIGIFGSIIGLTAIFWHLSVLAASVFIAATFAAISLNVWYTNSMAKINASNE